MDSAVTAEQFTGFSKLNKEDMDLMKSKLGRKKKGKGGKRKAAAVDENDAKRKKTAEEDEVEKKLKVGLSCIICSSLIQTLYLLSLPYDFPNVLRSSLRGL